MNKKLEKRIKDKRQKEKDLKSNSNVQSNYKKGLWGVPMLRLAVSKGVLSPEEFETITKEKYN